MRFSSKRASFPFSFSPAFASSFSSLSFVSILRFVSISMLLIFCFSFFSTPVFSAEAIDLKKLKEQKMTSSAELAAAQNQTSRSIMTIEAKKRAEDYLKAYQLIRQNNPSSRIFFKLANGTTLTNIADVTVLENGTLMLFKTTTTQGLKNDVIPVEEIIALGHL